MNLLRLSCMRSTARMREISKMLVIPSRGSQFSQGSRHLHSHRVHQTDSYLFHEKNMSKFWWSVRASVVGRTSDNTGKSFRGKIFSESFEMSEECKQAKVSYRVPDGGGQEEYAWKHGHTGQPGSSHGPLWATEDSGKNLQEIRQVMVGVSSGRTFNPVLRKLTSFSD